MPVKDDEEKKSEPFTYARYREHSGSFLELQELCNESDGGEIKLEGETLLKELIESYEKCQSEVASVLNDRKKKTSEDVPFFLKDNSNEKENRAIIQSTRVLSMVLKNLDTQQINVQYLRSRKNCGKSDKIDQDFTLPRAYQEVFMRRQNSLSGRYLEENEVKALLDKYPWEKT